MMSALSVAIANTELVVPHNDDAASDSGSSSPLCSSPAMSLLSLLPPPSPSLSLLLPLQNNHLAVLLPRHLWKPDTAATECDNFFCAVKFTVFERRHHCRKCGGVFCKSCTSRSLPLLDTTNLPFSHPPRDIPLSHYESPTSPLVTSRVCDQCWDQIHGCPSAPRTPDQVPHSSPILLSKFAFPGIVPPPPGAANDSGASSFSSGGSSTLATPPNDHVVDSTLLRVVAPFQRRPLRAQSSSSSLVSHTQLPQRAPSRAATLPGDREPSYGELDAYPLRRSSLLCKASGGGRWEPKQAPVLVGCRIPVPGGKAPFEVQLEAEAEVEKQRKENPIIRNGDFQLRFPRDPEPRITAARYQISTF